MKKQEASEFVVGRAAEVFNLESRYSTEDGGVTCILITTHFIRPLRELLEL